MPRTSGNVSVVETLIAIGDLEQAEEVAAQLPPGDDKAAALAAIASAVFAAVAAEALATREMI